MNGNVNTVRKNIAITDNIVTAKGTNIGNEGIGLNQWDGAVIARNIISGVGDDMIGIHFSQNINIHNNFLAGVDGRLFVSNTKSFVINDNWVERTSSPLNGQWYPGISLIYIGHEGDATNNFSAPSDFTVRGNTLVYNSGAVDNGAAIYVYGPRNGLIDSNNIINNSSLTTAVGLQLLPFLYSVGTWTDPANIDPLNISRVHSITISKNNFSSGTFSMTLQETGNTCANYIGPVTISDNVAGNYQFICSPTTVNNLIK